MLVLFREWTNYLIFTMRMLLLKHSNYIVINSILIFHWNYSKNINGLFLSNNIPILNMKRISSCEFIQFSLNQFSANLMNNIYSKTSNGQKWKLHTSTDIFTSFPSNWYPDRRSHTLVLLQQNRRNIPPRSYRFRKNSLKILLYNIHTCRI